MSDAARPRGRKPAPPPRQMTLEECIAAAALAHEIEDMRRALRQLADTPHGTPMEMEWLPPGEPAAARLVATVGDVAMGLQFRLAETIGRLAAFGVVVPAESAPA
jgi:hypothetical protein